MIVHTAQKLAGIIQSKYHYNGYRHCLIIQGNPGKRWGSALCVPNEQKYPLTLESVSIITLNADAAKGDLDSFSGIPKNIILLLGTPPDTPPA